MTRIKWSGLAGGTAVVALGLLGLALCPPATGEEANPAGITIEEPESGDSTAVEVSTESEATSGTAGETRDAETASGDGEEPTTVFEEILVSAAAPSGPIGTEREIGREEITEIPYGDAAEVLRNVSGMAVGRMGGHGLEPRLRGLGDTHLNVVLDGAYVHNACPSRMDPPTSFGAVESFERVVVLKGVQTMRYGGGGSAGTILYQRETPRFTDDERWRLSLGSSAATHSASPDLTVDATVGSPKLYVRVIGERRDMDSYEDGDGNEVRTAFQKRDANLFLGWTPDEWTTLELSYENNRTEDALFPGAGMDAPSDENQLYRLQLQHLRPDGRVTAIESEVYWGEIDHRMDNYSLRPLTAPMAAQALTASDTWGGRASIDLDGGERLRFTLGTDLQVNHRRAVRLVGPSPNDVSREQSFLWPDATVRDAGLFAEGIRDFEAGHRLRFGARADHWSAAITAADLQPFGPNLSPRELYETYYGVGASDWDHDDVGGLLRYEHRLRPGWTLFSGLSRSVRPADATERFLASNNARAALRWIGNPGLEPEKHHQLDLGISTLTRGRRVSALVFFDRVDDFILRDRARGQEGILRSDLATIYRNVEAELFGLELDVRQRITDHLSLLGNTSWVHATDTTDDRPLYQIPPLQGRLRADFERHRWEASATLRYAFEQTRVDDDPTTGSGLDAGETPGYTVYDLLGSYALRQGLKVQVGVENVFDRQYANHLNRSNLFDPGQVRVNEPGRTFWLKLRVRAGG